MIDDHSSNLMLCKHCPITPYSALGQPFHNIANVHKPQLSIQIVKV